MTLPTFTNSLTLKWNTSQRPTHSQSRQAPLRTSTKGKGKHKSPSQRRRDFRRLQAWKASRRHQDVKSSKDTSNGAPSQLECNTVKSEQKVSVNSITHSVKSRDINCHSSNLSKDATTQCKHVQWEDGSSQTQNNPTSTSETQTACVQSSSHGIQTVTSQKKSEATQSELINSTAMPHELVEYYADRRKALDSDIDYYDFMDRKKDWINHHAPIVADKSITHHINLSPPRYKHNACVQYAEKVGSPNNNPILFDGGLEVTYLFGDSVFQNEFVVRHVSRSSIPSSDIYSKDRKYERKEDIAKMILALKEHIRIHKCRKWNFKFMNIKGKSDW